VTNLAPETVIPARADFEHQHDETVRAEIERFRGNINEYLAGNLTDDQFRALRLRFGCYGQRQPGVQMIRTKIPGGKLTAAQLDALAAVSDEFAAGKGHFTTRQNLQYHFVPLAQVPDLMHKLADYGLTTREACFNTVRNVTASPYTGLTRDEVFDVTPYVQKVAYTFLRKKLTDAMPRKFKIAFDGGGAKDRALCGIHDMGIRAVIQDGKRGFHIVIAGGLGPLPTEAQVLDEFLPEERLVNRVEAVLRVFNQYGNRQNKNKARLKFVLRERGIVWLKEAIDKEYADILENGGIEAAAFVPEGFGGFESNPQPLGNGSLLPVVNKASSGDAEYDRWLSTNVEEQRQPGYAIVTALLPQGNLTADQMRGLAAIARTAGDGTLRVVVDQNLLIPFVQLGNLPRVYAALSELKLADAGAHEIDDVTSCPGAYSCNLALTKSMNLGAALASTVRGYDHPELRKLSIKISGCPNSCGQHWISDFGFYGNARKINGKEVPYYQMLLGGGEDENGVLRFGFAIQSIPAKLAPQAVQRVLEHYLEVRQEGESFRQYVLRHKVEFFRQKIADLAKPPELFPEMYQDWGDNDAFSLKLGRGECAA
jgi:sulfite reductase beta subunit-like hemoprotein